MTAVALALFICEGNIASSALPPDERIDLEMQRLKSQEKAAQE